MKKLIAPALLSLMAMSGYVFAQSATETQRETQGAGSRNAASDASGTPRQPGANDAQAGTTTRAQSSNAGGQAAQGGMLDQHIAVCLLLGNQEEVALGQFAQDRAQHPEVKQFAQMMAQEHQEAIAKIQQAAPQAASMNLELTLQEGQSGAGARDSTAGATTSARPGSGQNAGNQRSSATGAQGGGQNQQLVQLEREVKQECLNLTTAELGRKQGAEFDKAYIGQQLVAHTGMLAQLKVAQRHVSNEMQPIIQQGIQMTEHHLAQGRQIMEQLAAAGEGAGQAPRPGAQPNRQ